MLPVKLDPDAVKEAPVEAVPAAVERALPKTAALSAGVKEALTVPVTTISSNLKSPFPVEVRLPFSHP